MKGATLGGISNTQDGVSSIDYPNNSNFIKNTLVHGAFSTLLSVFGYPDETLFLVFDIQHEHYMELLIEFKSHMMPVIGTYFPCILLSTRTNVY